MRERRDGFEISALVIFGGGSLALLAVGALYLSNPPEDAALPRPALALGMIALGLLEAAVLVAYLRRARWAAPSILALCAFHLSAFAWQVWVDLDFVALVGIPVSAYVFYVIYDSRGRALPRARTA